MTPDQILEVINAYMPLATAIGGTMVLIFTTLSTIKKAISSMIDTGKTHNKEQQEKIALREQRQREEDLKQLNRLIRKYADNITIKVDHYISDNLGSGVIGHRRDCPDYENIEEIKSDIDGNIEIAICVCD